MPTTGVVNGTNLRISIGGDPVAYATSCSLSMSREELDTLSKDSVSSWKSSKVGTKSATLSGSGLYTEDATISSADRQNPNTLFDAFDGGTLVTWEFTTGVTGDTKYSGSGYITELSFTGEVEQNATYDFTLSVAGAVTQATIS